MNIAKSYFEFCRYAMYAGLLFWAGILARTYNLPPLPQIEALAAEIIGVVDPIDRVLATDPVSEQDADPVAPLNAVGVQPGLIALLTLASPRTPIVRIIDRNGALIHEWRPLWRDVWPDDEGTFVRRPKNGIYGHGLLVLPDASFIMNFEHYSTFRMDVCGEAVWKLENYGHHSVSMASDGTVWVPAEEVSSATAPGFVSHHQPLRSYLLEQIDVDGNVLRSINLLEVLINNDLQGLLFLRSPTAGPVSASGDTLHLNDIEVVPAGVESPHFRSGDLIISMRDINTIMALDPHTEEVKWVHTGGFVRQHDPEFTKSGKISIYDNQSHLGWGQSERPFSRILEIDPASDIEQTIIGAQSEKSFFSTITGSHQRLANGNILVVAAQQGRLLEFTPEGGLAWRYDARISDMKNGRIFNAQVLPPDMDKAFFETTKQRCEA